MNRKEVQRRFGRHIPTDGQNQWLDLARMHTTKLAEWVDEYCPEGVEKEQAFNKLDEFLYYVNGSILRPIGEKK